MSAPTTAFEDSGGTTWTTLAEEATFLAALDAYSAHVTVTQVGTSVNGLPLRLVTVADGTPARWALVVAQQHGAEVSGREAALQFARDLADEPDLGGTGWLFLPTMNPDGFGFGTGGSRENANGVNINRDHIPLSQPETRVIAQVIRDYAPVLVVDAHEGQNIAADYATSGTYNPNTHPGIRDLADELEDVAWDAILGTGRTVERYQGGNIVGPEYLHTHAALRHAVAILLETRRSPGNDSAPPPARRVMLHMAALTAIRDWHVANTAAVDAAAAASRAAVSTTAPFVMATGTAAEPWPEIAPRPLGYNLTSGQQAAIATHRSLFDIDTSLEGSAHRALLDQAAGPLLPYLLDSTSSLAVVSATRYNGETPAPLPPIGVAKSWRINVGSGSVTPLAVKLGTDAGTVTVWP